MKIYGDLVATYKWNSNGQMGGIMNRTLEVYHTKSQVKVVLWHSGFKGWKSRWCKPLNILRFSKEEMEKVDLGALIKEHYQVQYLTKITK